MSVQPETQGRGCAYGDGMKLTAKDLQAYRSDLEKMVKTNPVLGKAAEEEMQDYLASKAASGTRKRKAPEEGKIMFNKLSFENKGAAAAATAHTDKSKAKRGKNLFPRDPKQALAKVTQEKAAIEALRQSDPKKAHVREEKDAWAKAIFKATGMAVHDDPKRLKKAAQRREKEKERGRQRWEELQEKVKGEQETKQAKRRENIESRNATKKMKKSKQQSRR